MKKIVKVSALALLAMGLVFNFASCSNGDDDSGSGDQDVEVTPSGNNETTTTDTTTTTTTTTDTTTTTVTVTTVWDFKEGATTSAALTTAVGTSGTKPSSDIVIASDSGSGATLTLLAQNGCSLKSNGGLQLGAGTKETDILKITTDAACTLTITGKNATGDTWTNAKMNSFSVNGENIYTRTAATETDDMTWSVNLVKGDNTLAGSGIKFYKFTCN